MRDGVCCEGLGLECKVGSVLAYGMFLLYTYIQSWSKALNVRRTIE